MYPDRAPLPPILSSTGPGQSNFLIHFCGRKASSPSTPHVPSPIRAMTPQERLDSILTTGTIRGFTPFRAHGPAVCLSESPGDHLLHMLTERGMPPWGVLLRRADVIAAGGGGIAYPPESVHQQWPEDVQVWGNPIRTDGRGLLDFSWEREWRIPGESVVLKPKMVAAVLIGDPDWKPSPVATEWVNSYTGEPLPPDMFPEFTPEAVRLNRYPSSWTDAEHLYWDGAALRLMP